MSEQQSSTTAVPEAFNRVGLFRSDNESDGARRVALFRERCRPATRSAMLAGRGPAFPTTAAGPPLGPPLSSSPTFDNFADLVDQRIRLVFRLAQLLRLFF